MTQITKWPIPSSMERDCLIAALLILMWRCERDSRALKLVSDHEAGERGPHVPSDLGLRSLMGAGCLLVKQVLRLSSTFFTPARSTPTGVPQLLKTASATVLSVQPKSRSVCPKPMAQEWLALLLLMGLLWLQVKGMLKSCAGWELMVWYHTPTVPRLLPFAWQSWFLQHCRTNRWFLSPYSLQFPPLKRQHWKKRSPWAHPEVAGHQTPSVSTISGAFLLPVGLLHCCWPWSSVILGHPSLSSKWCWFFISPLQIIMQEKMLWAAIMHTSVHLCYRPACPDFQVVYPSPSSCFSTCQLPFNLEEARCGQVRFKPLIIITFF